MAQLSLDLGDASNSLHRKVDFGGSYREVLEKSLLNYLLREKVLEKSLNYLSREKVWKKLKVNCFPLKKSSKTIVGIIVGRLLRRFDDYPDDY